MKITTIVSMMFTFMLSSLLILAGPRTGQGRQVDATIVAQKITDLNAFYISVYNQGTSDVFCLVNSYTNEISIRVTNGTSILVPAGATFDFKAPSDNRRLKNLVLITTNYPSAVIIGGF